MSKIDLNQLDDIQYDVLKEIGNIGAGNATTALSKMLNQKMDMSVPKVDIRYNGRRRSDSSWYYAWI